MKNLTFKRVLSILLTLCLTLSLMPVNVLAASGAAPVCTYVHDADCLHGDGAQVKANGSFVVELWEDGAYRTLASFDAGKLKSDFTLELGQVQSPKLRISKLADGMAILDAVLLDGAAPAAVNGGDAYAYKKLSAKDHDVLEVKAEGVVLEFGSGGTLVLTGRIEPEVIEGFPFVFDAQMGTSGNAFALSAPYAMDNIGAIEIDGVPDVLDIAGAFRAYPTVSSFSGHPDGVAYIWVKNDADYLYVAAEWTGDNTYDYGLDFIKVFVDGGKGVQEFTQWSDRGDYGMPAFAYTDLVPHEHMCYELKIPLAELGNPDSVKLGFSMYGTYTAGIWTEVSPDNSGTAAVANSENTPLETVDYPAATIPNDRILKLTAAPQPGYEFSHWEIEAYDYTASGDAEFEYTTGSATAANAVIKFGDDVNLLGTYVEITAHFMADGTWAGASKRAASFAALNPAAKTLEVNTAAELGLFAFNLMLNAEAYKGYTVTLTGNIDLTGANWQPVNAIGLTLNGGGKTISGMNVVDYSIDEKFAPEDGVNCWGFFGLLESSQVRDVTFSSPTITATKFDWDNDAVGVLAGSAFGSQIRSVKIINPQIDLTCEKRSYGIYVGGLVGFAGPLDNGDPSTKNIIDSAEIHGGNIGFSAKQGAKLYYTSIVGGIAGGNYFSVISNSAVYETDIALDLTDAVTFTTYATVALGGIAGYSSIENDGEYGAMELCLLNNLSMASFTVTNGTQLEILVGGICGFLDGDNAVNNLYIGGKDIFGEMNVGDCTVSNNHKYDTLDEFKADNEILGNLNDVEVGGGFLVAASIIADIGGAIETGLSRLRVWETFDAVNDYFYAAGTPKLGDYYVTDKPVVDNIKAPTWREEAPISLTAPKVTAGKTSTAAYGWQISDNDTDGWDTFTPPSKADMTLNGKFLRYFAENSYGESYSNVVKIKVVSKHSREVTVAMWDDYGDGWNGNAALRISINTNDLTPNAKISSGNGPAYYYFDVELGDQIKFYWVEGQYDYEAAFAVYYADTPLVPGFTPNGWSGANALLYKVYDDLDGVLNDTELGSFTVEAPPVTPITTAAISVTAPVVAVAPNTTATGSGNFSIGAVSWTPTVSGGKFLGGTQYTATVTLTANSGYAFTGLTTATINGNAATVSNNTGDKATLSYQFAVTGAKTVAGISIASQPTKLSYSSGETLDLTGLSVTLTYNDGTTSNVAFADFGTNDLTASLANGTTLSVSHNGTAVTVTHTATSNSAQTNTLTVGNANQAALTVNAVGTKTYGDAAFQLSTSGGSGGGAVTYALVSGPGTVTTDGLVTITGAGSIVVNATKAGDTDYNGVTSANLTVTVNKKDITITGATITEKVYDGNTTIAAASVTPTFSESGITCSVSAASYTDNANAGQTKPTTFTVTLTGTYATNYNLTNPTYTGATANITKKNISINTVAAPSKVYDGDMTATAGTVTFTGAVGTLTVSTDYTASVVFTDNANVGSGTKNYTYTVTLQGTAASNYNLTADTKTGTNGTITAAPISGTVTITGTVLPSQTLTANVSGISPTGATLSYQWSVGGTNAGTGSTYQIQPADASKTITVTVTGTGNYSGSKTSSATTAVPYTINLVKQGGNANDKVFFGTEGTTTTYSASGTVSIGYVLDSTGEKENKINYSPVAITAVTTAGSGTSSYTVNPTDATDGVITITATFTHTDKANVTITETAQTKTYNGSAQGFDISGTHSAIGGFTITYDGSSTVPSNAGTYNIVITRDADSDYYAYSKTITGGLVINAAALTGTPTISIGGTQLQVGAELTADTSTMTPDSGYTYQWKADNMAISGATSSTYTVTAADLGKTITVTVTASGNHTGNATSAATDKVPYKVVVVDYPISGGDSVTGKTEYKNASDTVAITYTLSSGALINTLSLGHDITITNTAATSYNYTVNASHATNGTITLTPTFTHQSTLSSGSVTVTAPVKGQVPSAAATTDNSAFYTATAAWSGTLVSGQFTGGEAYTVTVTLSAQGGATFDNGFTLTINGENATKSSVIGTTAVFTYTFPALAAKAVSSIAVTTQPTTTVYYSGDTLDLTGLVIKVDYDDGSTENMTHPISGATYSKNHGAELKSAQHNIPITVTYGTKTADTAAITVNKLTVSIAPSGNGAGDSVSLSVADADAGDTITVNYTLANLSILNELSITRGINPIGKTAAASGSISYTANRSHANTSGAIALTAAFTHDSTMHSANVNVTPPSKGATPQGTVTAVTNYTGTISWTATDNPFAANTAYTATVTLTATGVGAKFASTFTPTINGIKASNVNVASGGGTVTFSYTFPKTADKAVTALSVKTQPELSYNIGDKLDLSKLVMSVTYDGGIPVDVPFTNLTGAAFEIDGRAVVNSDTLFAAQNGKAITVTFGGQTDTTSNLTVYTPPVIKAWVTGITEDAATINFTYSKGVAVLQDSGGSPVTLSNSTATSGDVTLSLTPNTDYKYTLVVTDATPEPDKIFTIPVSFKTLPQSGATIRGTVKDDTALTIVVTLEHGNTVIASVTAGESPAGTYGFQFTNVPDGIYNLVVDNGSYKVTQAITVSNNSAANTVIDMSVGKTQSVVDIKSNDTPPAAVDGLPALFEVPDLYTPADQAVINESGTVEMKLSVEKQDTPTDAAAINNEAGSTQEIGMFLDISVIKSHYKSDGELTHEEKLPDLGESKRLTITFELPSALSGKTITAIYRAHGAGVDTLTTDSTAGEYFVQNGNIITLYVYKFSTYALAVAKDTGNGGNGGNSGNSDNGGGNTGGNTETETPPVKSTIITDFDDMTVKIGTFGKYTSYTVEVTAEQSKKITTAVVNEPDGTQRHVPTYVYQDGGKWYAKVYSLTNSVYTLIYNELSFTDSKGKWYESTVNEMASRKIIAGIGNNLFAGERDITRAEFAAIVIRALGLPSDGDGTVFGDVPASAWYAGAVGKAYEYGIVAGIGNNLFVPDKKITRQEAMLMIQRAAQIIGFVGAVAHDSPQNIDAFPDVGSVSAWALDAAKWNVGSGLVVGSNGMLRPLDNITRAETATLVLKLLQKAGLVDMRTPLTTPPIYRQRRISSGEAA